VTPWPRICAASATSTCRAAAADHRLYCTWFSGGLRMLDISDPTAPEEIGWYIPEPVSGHKAPRSNDVFVDARGLVYQIDRDNGFDILEPVQ
jgi:hypothetical protein